MLNAEDFRQYDDTSVSGYTVFGNFEWCTSSQTVELQKLDTSTSADHVLCVEIPSAFVCVFHMQSIDRRTGSIGMELTSLNRVIW